MKLSQRPARPRLALRCLLAIVLVLMTLPLAGATASPARAEDCDALVTHSPDLVVPRESDAEMAISASTPEWEIERATIVPADAGSMPAADMDMLVNGPTATASHPASALPAFSVFQYALDVTVRTGGACDSGSQQVRMPTSGFYSTMAGPLPDEVNELLPREVHEIANLLVDLVEQVAVEVDPSDLDPDICASQPAACVLMDALIELAADMEDAVMDELAEMDLDAFLDETSVEPENHEDCYGVDHVGFYINPDPKKCQGQLLDTATGVSLCTELPGDDCTTVGFVEVRQTALGTVGSLTATAEVGGYPAGEVTDFYESRTAGTASSSQTGLQGHDCRTRHAVEAYNQIRWKRSSFKSYTTYMKRTDGCSDYRASTHATVAQIVTHNGDEFVDVRWPTSNTTCHQQNNVNSAAVSCESPWHYTTGGQQWVGTMGGHYDLHNNGTTEWRQTGDLDLRHTDDSY